MSSVLDEEKTWSQRDFGLDARLVKALSKLGYIYPTLVQAKCIPIVLQGKDALVRARTGSGKTIAFALPLLHKLLLEKSGGGDDAEERRIRSLILAPTKELCKQIEKHMVQIMYYCKDVISICSLSDDNMSVQTYRLKNKPDIVVATPAKVVQHIAKGNIDLSYAKMLIIDEADLILSFGYTEDVQLITSQMPVHQGLLMSATLSPDLDKFKRILLRCPAILKLEEEEKQAGHLLQFYLQSTERDKFLILFVFLKLGLLQGKGLIFVNDVDKCYRLKLFLQQFYISAAVLNAEVPLNSRLHILEEYNRGVFDYLIATDASIDKGEEDEEVEEVEEAPHNEEEVELEAGAESKDGEEEEEEEGDGEGEEGFDYGDSDSEEEEEEEEEKEKVKVKESNKKEDQKKRGRNEAATDVDESKSKNSVDGNKDRTSSFKRDYGVSRGIDFHNVTFVLNFDMPPTSSGYTHRIGRTARGGASGTSLSFVTLADKTSSKSKKDSEVATRDARVLREVRHQQPRLGAVEGDNVLAAIGSVDGDMAADDEGRMQPSPLIFNFQELDNFRYRVEDTLRSVTSVAVKELRMAEIKREILNSNKLKAYFAENPNDLKVLRHDKAILHPIKQKEHLKYVPEYLIPASMKGVVTTTGHKKKRRKVNQHGVHADKKITKSKNKDPLMNLPPSDEIIDPTMSATESEAAPAPKGTYITDKNEAGENLYTWRESQAYSTAGRKQWKQKRKKGQYNPKQKQSGKMQKKPGVQN